MADLGTRREDRGELSVHNLDGAGMEDALVEQGDPPYSVAAFPGTSLSLRKLSRWTAQNDFLRTKANLFPRRSEYHRRGRNPNCDNGRTVWVGGVCLPEACEPVSFGWEARRDWELVHHGPRGSRYRRPRVGRLSDGQTRAVR